MKTIMRTVSSIPVLLLGALASAQDVVVTSPVTTTADDDDAVVIFNSDSSITNLSDVRTEGQSADALRISGDNTSITNAAGATVTTTGDNFSVGIRIRSDSGTVVNDGSVVTTGINGDGIILFGSNGDLTNNGLIDTSGNGADSFINEGFNTTFRNNGSIVASGGIRNGFDNATGVFMAGRENQLINSATGTIEATGFDATAVNGGISPIIINDGSIMTTGQGGVAVDSFVSIFGDPQAIILNNGLIESQSEIGGSAIRYWGDHSITNTATISSINTAIEDRGEESVSASSIANFGNITSGGTAIDSDAGSLSVDNAGTIDGDIFLGVDEDSFMMRETGEVIGIVDGGDDADELLAVLDGGDRTQSGDQLLNFESFNLTGNGVFTAAGTWDLSPLGTVRVDGGNLSLDNSQFFLNTLTVGGGAELSGTGEIFGSVIGEAGSTIGPGFSPGILNIDGDFSLLGGLLEIEIGGANPGEFDQINVGGIANLVFGEILFTFIDDFLPEPNFVFDFFNAEELFVSDAVTFSTSGLPDGAGLITRVGKGGIIVASIPGPATLGLFGLGLLGLGVLRRKC